ncbi:hypothetical protein [Sulfuricurvum sp.]
MNSFLVFKITGDPSFDFFFSLPASLSILYYIASAGFSIFRGRI